MTPGFVARHPTYCAERRGRLIGFYAIGGRGAVRELAHLWVHPRGIGSGIGRLLLEHLRDRLRALRVTELRIAADPNAVSPFAKPNMSRGPLLFGRIARSG
ncbi:MAG: GNAT family N-acetyltransferase [bacterium]